MIRKLFTTVLLAASIAVCAPSADAAQACDSDVECSGSDACIGGACVPPVPDPIAYTTEAMTRWSSYVWAVQFPSLFELDGVSAPEDCCFDYTGDGVADDGYGAILGLLASFLTEADPVSEMDQALESGTSLKVFDWRELADDLTSSDVQLSVFDGRWTDATPYEQRIQGYGHATFLDHSFGDFGALDQLNAGTVATGLVDVTGNQFTLLVPAIMTGELMTAHLQEPRLQAPVIHGEPPQDPCLGLCTVDEDRGANHSPQIVGGGKLGGVIVGDEVLTYLDGYFRQCACAGVDPTEPVIIWGVNTQDGTFDVECNPLNTGDPSGCGQGDSCANLTTMCGVIAVFPLTFDIDHDDDAVNESWSIGLRLGFSGTTLDPMNAIFVDGFESGDTTGWTASVP